MCVLVADFHSRALIALAMCALVCAACGATAEHDGYSVSRPDEPALAPGVAGSGGAGGTVMDVGTGAAQTGLAEGCDIVRMDEGGLLEEEADVTARYTLGVPYTKTVMLFGGEPDARDNILGNGYIFGLDKADAQVLAAKYPDFHLCSSPGGMEAENFIIPYDLVPANCDVFDQIVTALAQYDENVTTGGDRTSLRFDGVPLELESVIAPDTGEDVMDQVSPTKNFHLVTGVEQLTGESVLSFGTNNSPAE